MCGHTHRNMITALKLGSMLGTTPTREGKVCGGLQKNIYRKSKQEEQERRVFELLYWITTYTFVQFNKK